MLRKLLKYDLRANMKIYLFIWPAIVIFAVIERMAISADLEGKAAAILISTTTTIFVLAVVAAMIFAVIISIVRFYSGLLRDEGYLMFTLPVKTWQLLLSKLLTAVLTVAVTTLISVISIAFLFDGIQGFYDTFHSLWEVMDMPTGLTLGLTCSIALVSIFVSILQVYLSCSLGHLFRRHRVVWSILIYYGISIAMEFFSVVSLVSADSFKVLDDVITEQSATNIMLLVVLCVQILLGTAYFFFSQRILSRKLNLE